MGGEIDTDHARRLDGNAAGGLLRELFAVEMTSAISTCAGCGSSRVIAELMLYGSELGAILRCPVCDQPVIRLTCVQGVYWLDIRGATVLRIPAT
jgi:Family of unknown function (DUF6510)